MALPTQLAETPKGLVEYRLTGAGSKTVLALHSGHLSAAVPLGERVFLDLGLRVLAVSRSGYGRTPAATAPSRNTFAGVIACLCRHLEIDSLAAAVGMSHGGPAAVAVAALHPELVQRLILESSISSLAWPTLGTRLAAYVIFSSWTEPLTWRVTGAMARWAPGVFLRSMLGALSTGSGSRVMADLSPTDRIEVLNLFKSMRATPRLSSRHSRTC